MKKEIQQGNRRSTRPPVVFGIESCNFGNMCTRSRGLFGTEEGSG
jgi:hypothetical protein